MSSLKLNETPVRTSRNFNINNIKLENIDLPNKIKKFQNVIINKESQKDLIYDNIHDFEIKYGLGIEKYIKENSNSKIKLNVITKTTKDI